MNGRDPSQKRAREPIADGPRTIETEIDQQASTMLDIREGFPAASEDLDTVVAGVSDGAAARTRVPAEVRYAVAEVLGAGGMGEVRLVRDRWIGRDVALKMLHPELERNQAALGRFLREIRVQGQLEHPSIVPMYDVGTAPDGSLYFTMRRVRGPTLFDVISALARGDEAMSARYSRRKLLTAFASICLVVHYAHTRGILHRDIKPGNIMLGEFGEVYVLDWGIAKAMEQIAVERALDLEDDLSRAGQVIGTPGYMAPEQALGMNDDLDARADVYALGTMLYEILTLEPLFAHRSVEDSVQAAVAPHAAAHPSAVAPDVSAELDAICARATAHHRAERYASAGELAEAVEQVLDGAREAERRRAMAIECGAQAARAAARAMAPATAPADAQTARSEAVRAAFNALALDAAQPEARRTLVDLLIEVPERVPAGVEQEMAAADDRVRANGARLGSRSFFAYLTVIPIVLLIGVRSWPVAGAITVLTVGSALYARWLARHEKIRSVHSLALLGMSSAFIGLTACWLGPFVLVPTLATLNTVMFVMHGSRAERPWMALVGMATVVAPFAAEWFGIVPRSYGFSTDHVMLFARGLDVPPFATTFGLVYTAVSLVAISSFMMGRLRDAMAIAERKQFLHAWHLRNLFPAADVDRAS